MPRTPPGCYPDWLARAMIKANVKLPKHYTLRWQKQGQVPHPYKVVLKLAEVVDTFTADCLCPAIDKERARNACSQLAALGRIRIVRRGKRGHKGAPTVYAAL